MLSNSSDGSIDLGPRCRRIAREFGKILLTFSLLGAFPSLAHAVGGACANNGDCNTSPNFCRPGVCDIFGQCQYQHDDTMCLGARVCIGGSNNGATCTAPANCPGSSCVGGSNNGANCTVPANCPGGTCTAATCSTGLCAGGVRAGNPCTNNSHCPGSTCTQGANHDNLFCNGDDFCNETTQRCDVNPVNCQQPTPHCSENLDSCVACLNNNHCGGTCIGGSNNGLACNNASQCPGGSCSDPDPTRNICGSSGTCVQCASDVHCNDGLACNGTETCNTGTGLCQAGTPVTCTTKRCFGGTNIGGTCTTNANCPGGGVCEVETCSEVFQGCAQCESASECDDGLYCNGAESCNLQGRCAAGTAVVCKRCNGGTFGVCQTDAECQNSTCTAAGFCDEIDDTCVQCLADSHCPADVTFCTDQACVFNSCVQAADPVGNCGDGIYCNGDEVCLNNQIGSVCTNCMIAHPSTCQGGSRNGQTCGFPVNCPGGTCVSHESDCKRKVCNSMSSTPPYKVCTTNADCPAGVQCVDACCGSGTAVDCEDGIACTLNKCNEASDSCTVTRPTKTCNNPARTLCDTNADCPAGFTCSGGPYCNDGSFCNGEEVCGAAGCENITPRVCYNTETEIPCVTDDDCKFCTAGPNEGDPCEDAADCPAGACSGTTCQVNCRHLTADTGCTRGDCNESTDQCVATPIRINQPCEDGTACTINEICNASGSCIPNPNLPPTDAYRCVKLEWRNVTPTELFPGQTLTADLYAVADGCAASAQGSCASGSADIVGLRALLKWNNIQLGMDPPAATNPVDPCNSGGNACYRCQTCQGGSNPGAQCVARCSGGPRFGYACLTNSECSQVCAGGTQIGLPCTTSSQCPGSTCGVAATCSSTVNTCLGGPNNGLPCTIPADCPSTTGQPPASCSNQFTCLGGGTCSPVPATSQYDWGFSGFLNDCPTPDSAGDGINGPCPFSGFPGNDGNALYTSFDQLLPCTPSNEEIPSCVTPSGLFVTRFRFRALAGGTSTLAFDACLGNNSKTSVTSSVIPPPPLTSADVLKSITPSVSIQVKCNTTAECEDQNPCTSQTCNTATNTCVFTNVPGTACTDGLFCTATDTCSSTTCVGGSNNGQACTTAAQCPGGTCPTSTCTGAGARCTGNGQCVGGSNPGAACTSHSTCNNGWCTAVTTCDETNDRCVQCLASTTCRDNSICTQDVCDGAGMCQNPPVDCNDNLTCTVDSCAITSLNPPAYECRHTADSAVCVQNNPQPFCAAKICDPLSTPAATSGTGCVFDHQCVSANGNPCDNPASCNEGNDSCGGCFAPAVIGSGGRYLQITPAAAQAATPVALLVEGDCQESAINCISKYLSPKCVGGPNDGQMCLSDTDCPKRCLAGPNNGNPCSTDANCPAGSCRGYCEKGLFGVTPVYMTASQWGTVQAHGSELRPNGLYHVYSVCDFGGSPTISAATRTRTAKWGDTNNDPLDVVDFADISAVVNAFRNQYSTLETYQSTNLLGSGTTTCGDPQQGCVGQECINFGDVSGAVDAFRGQAFPCASTCP